MSAHSGGLPAIQAAMEALDALSAQLADARTADGARVLQLVAERQSVLERVAALLAEPSLTTLPPWERQALGRALDKSSQLGELARRAVEEQARQVGRELRALETLAESPDALATVGRIDAAG